MIWKDRIPTKANRKKIMFEDSSLGTQYATVEYADEPQEQGTPLNKGNLLAGFNAYTCGILSDTSTTSKIVTLPFSPYYIHAIGTLYTSWTRNEVVNVSECWFNGDRVKTGDIAKSTHYHLIENVNGKQVTFRLDSLRVDSEYYGGKLIYIAYRAPIE